MYLEIQLNPYDLRVRISRKLEKIQLKDMKKFAKLPFVSKIGLGGEPFRLKNWKKVIKILSKKKLSILSSVNYLTSEKIRFCEENAIEIVASFEKSKELEKKIVKLIFEKGIWFMTSSANKDQKIEKNINEKGSKLIYEKLIPYSKNELKINIIEKIPYVCHAGNQSIGSTAKGELYPCIAFRGCEEFCLGNIFLLTKKQIDKKLDEFRKKVKCDYCCQARSFRTTGKLNQDINCIKQYAGNCFALGK